MISNYNIHESRKVPLILNCLGCKGNIWMIKDEAKEKCKTSTGLLKMLNN